jgi:cytoskeletal protein RodZ
MPTLGQELRKKREERGSSLKDISLHTKISLYLLQALEEDRLDLLPELFFLKGVLRSYLRAIGADEAYFMGRLAEQTNSPARPKAEPAIEEPAPRRRPILRIAAIILVLAVVMAAGYVILKTRSHQAPAPVVTRPAAQALAVKPPETAPAAAPVESVKVPEPPLKLEMAFTADTWLNIKADGALVFEGLKTAGDSAVYTAEKDLLLQIGNAGGFTFKLNGKPGKPMGGSGAVRTDIRITPATLADFLNDPAAVPADR